MAMAFDPKQDYYEILQVHPSAHQEVVKRAYHTILGLLQAHPDLGGRHEDAVRVNEAYEVLSNPLTRRAYDEARRHLAEQQQRTVPAPAQAAPSPHTAPVFPRERVAVAAAAVTITRSPERHTVYCPWCGARNRLPSHTTLRHAYCGKCRAPLDSECTAHREYTPPIAQVRLSAQQAELINSHSELRLERALPPVDGRLHCMRCQFEWADRGGAHPLPERCPHCSSTRWSHFRIFACQYCQHQFCTANLHNWPYWLYPECPACHHAHWHAECEKHPLRWVLNQLTAW